MSIVMSTNNRSFTPYPNAIHLMPHRLVMQKRGNPQGGNFWGSIKHGFSDAGKAIAHGAKSAANTVKKKAIDAAVNYVSHPSNYIDKLGMAASVLAPEFAPELIAGSEAARDGLQLVGLGKKRRKPRKKAKSAKTAKGGAKKKRKPRKKSAKTAKGGSKMVMGNLHARGPSKF